MTNSEWINLLTDQFNISRATAKNMLHMMISFKRMADLKKQFSSNYQRKVIYADTDSIKYVREGKNEN